MNRHLHTRTIPAMGLAAQGSGLPGAAGVTYFELTASAQAGVEATQ
jgi:hypothetical protein